MKATPVARHKIAPKPAARSTPALVEEEGLARIELQRIEIRTIRVPIRGITPYISHPWSEKQKLALGGGKQPGLKPGARAPRRDTEEQEYEACRQLLAQPRDDSATDGMPAVAFKAAIIGAARLFENVTMTQLKSLIYVEGEPPSMLVPIKGKPHKREDIVRVGPGLSAQPDLRWRAEYWPWSVDLIIQYPDHMLSVASVLSLVDAAGRGGVGEWRPSAPKSLTGTFGMFEMDMEEQVRREGAR